MPVSKPKKGAKKEAPAPEPASPDPAEKKKKKGKKEKPSDAPVFPKMLVGPDMTPEQAQSQAPGWRSSVVISKKFAVGSLATSNFK